MKRFWGFVQKEWYHIFRDRRTLLILFGMPVVQILLFGYAVTNEVREARIAILDQSHDQHSLALKSRLLTSSYFQLEAELSSEAELEPIFQAGRVKQILVFPPNFGTDLEREGVATLQILADATDPNLANTLQTYTMAIVQQYQQVSRLKLFEYAIAFQSLLLFGRQAFGLLHIRYHLHLETDIVLESLLVFFDQRLKVLVVRLADGQHLDLHGFKEFLEVLELCG